MCENWRGKPDVTTQKELWKILDLANWKPDDIFCDLGCGYGNLCRWAIKKIKRAIGIEDHEKRYRRAVKNTRKYSSVKILNKDYRCIQTIKKLRTATIFYCTNGQNPGFYKKLERTVDHKAYLITYCPPPYPLKPEKFSGLFYATKIPFTVARTKTEWLRAIAKNGSMSEFRRRFMIDFDDSHEYKERLLDINEEIIGIDWIRQKHNSATS